MPKNQNRVKTSYPGVYYVEGVSQTTGKKERVYYIRYRRDGRLLEEKAGRQFQDDMTPARAALIRGQRIEGKQESNQERREAARAAKEAEAGRWTIDRLWAEYKAHRVDNKGLRVDENRFKNYLAEPFGKKEPHELIQLDIDRLRIRLLKKLSPQTVRHILALLKRIVLFGARKGLCADLAFSIEMPKVDNQKTEDLTPDQLNALLEALDNSSNFQVANLMRLALFTGMRRGELLRLQWQDVDFDRGFIRITESKGGKASSIPLNDPARELLGRHPKTGSPYMFPGRGGK